MAIYAIGDIQGCYDELLQLLDTISFDRENDQLWFTGDLVNRGPKSLATLRFVKSLGDTAITVLGNHDLHLLAASGSASAITRKDTLQAVLEAPDRDELIDWLRHRPLLYCTETHCLLHAGLPPQWSFRTAQKMASAVEKLLQSPDYHYFLSHMYGDKPNRWSLRLQGLGKLRFSLNCLTRMRYCTVDGRLDFNHSGPPGSQPEGLIPWFSAPNRKNTDRQIIFGHWSSLGYHEGSNCYGIDTGCVWGGQLTAIKLASPIQRISIDCAGYKKIDYTAL
jgi:bis(5'-nucleosyl)-tetraphosphatase (symmetrical)